MSASSGASRTVPSGSSISNDIPLRVHFHTFNRLLRPSDRFYYGRGASCCQFRRIYNLFKTCSFFSDGGWLVVNLWKILSFEICQLFFCVSRTRTQGQSCVECIELRRVSALSTLGTR